MPTQMFLVQPRARDDDAAREEIAAFIAQRGGFVLMATSYGSLIAAFDDVHLDTVKHHALVDFAGGVTLDPSAPGAAALQQLFAQNVAAQLADRDNPLERAEAVFPPGYRPLSWPTAEPAPPRFLTTDPIEEAWHD